LPAGALGGGEAGFDIEPPPFEAEPPLPLLAPLLVPLPVEEPLSPFDGDDALGMSFGDE
jgi:hypothetical protein